LGRDTITGTRTRVAMRKGGRRRDTARALSLEKICRERADSGRLTNDGRDKRMHVRGEGEGGRSPNGKRWTGAGGTVEMEERRGNH
jgi:hypothetical protein